MDMATLTTYVRNVRATARMHRSSSFDESSIRVLNPLFTHAIHNYSEHVYVCSYTLPLYYESIQYNGVTNIKQ